MNKLKNIIDTRGRQYDYVIVGAGLAGITHAVKLSEYDIGCKILMIEKNSVIGGNVRDVNIDDIFVKIKGPHILHFDDDDIYSYLSRYTELNTYRHRVIANTGEEHVMLPFTMVTFMQLFNVSTIDDVKSIISQEISNWKNVNDIPNNWEPSNFEEQAICIVGTTMYEKLIKHYTEKQWGRDPKTLPASIIKRLPLRWNTDTTYFNNAKYQGIPVNGYTAMMESMLSSVDNLDIIFNVDVTKNVLKEVVPCLGLTGSMIFTGAIDELFNYSLGHLPYRSLRFENITLPIQNYQGTSVVNYTSKDVPFTRITEHKHFSTDNAVISKNVTHITKEYSEEFEPGHNEPFYPIGQDENTKLHKQYADLFHDTFNNSYLCGRLAEYKYYDMDKVIRAAFNSVKEILRNKNV